MTRTRSSDGTRRHGLVVATPAAATLTRQKSAGAKRERQRQYRVVRAAMPWHRLAAQMARAVSVTDAMGERCPIHTEEVTGSIPVSPTQVRGPVPDLGAGFSTLYSSEVQQPVTHRDCPSRLRAARVAFEEACA